MRSQQVEQWLDGDPNILWEYRESISLDHINEKKSYNNQARVEEPLTQSLVQEYRERLRQKERPPALVLYQDGNSYVIIDGNHRFASLKAEEYATTDAYIVVTDDSEERRDLTFAANGVVNGKRNSDFSSAEHAVTMMASGQSLRNVAKLLNVSKSFISDSVAESQGRSRAKDLGIARAWNNIPKVQGVLLQRAFVLDQVFAAAVNYVSKMELLKHDVKDFITQTKTLTSEQGQLTYINTRLKAGLRDKKLAKDAAVKGYPPKPKTKRTNAYASPVTAFYAQCVGVAKIDKSLFKGLTSDEAHQYLTSIRDAIVNLVAIEGILDA